MTPATCEIREKPCTKCGASLALESFYKDARYKDGTHSWCKSCVSHRANVWNQSNRLRVKLTKYGVNVDQLWSKQEGRCAVCSEALLPEGKEAKSVTVDHDHNCCKGDRSCGKCVRGLIHNQCNRVLGSAKDNPALLQAAAAYLLRWRGGML